MKSLRSRKQGITSRRCCGIIKISNIKKNDLEKNLATESTENTEAEAKSGIEKFQGALAKSPNPLCQREGVKKLKYSPSPCPLPQGGEGKYIEIQREIPSPWTGEGQGGGGKWIFSHIWGGKGGFSWFVNGARAVRIGWYLL
jgi:hypothetical protein